MKQYNIYHKQKTGKVLQILNYKDWLNLEQNKDIKKDKRLAKCPRCKGDGLDTDSFFTTLMCGLCKGKKKIKLTCKMYIQECELIKTKSQAYGFNVKFPEDELLIWSDA